MTFHFLFVPFNLPVVNRKPDFLIQGTGICTMPDIIEAVNARRVETLSICEMHNHASNYLGVGECLDLTVVDDSAIQTTAVIRKPNTISKIRYGVLTGFSIKFDVEQRRIVEIALVDAPTFETGGPEFGSVERVFDNDLLLHYWHERYLGASVDDRIAELEEKIYGPNQVENILWQRDIDELQLLLAIADLGAQRDRVFLRKAVVYELNHTKVIIKPDKNHFRPHFHIHYKRQHQASYAIDTLERLAGVMETRYERPILVWASRHQRSLRLTWDKLKEGEDVRELVLHSDEL